MSDTSSEEQIIRSCCRGCHGGCGVLVHLKNGLISKIEGDSECPTNHGTTCSIGSGFLQLVYHPDRIKFPLKRAGKRGEGNWQRISWDEALDSIAGNLEQVKKDYGAESIVMGTGTGRDYEFWFVRFAQQLGTPNVLTPGHICYGPRRATSLITCGDFPVCDYEGKPQCVVVWGANPVWSNPDEYTGENLAKVVSEGTKLIVVDPKLTYLAGRADIWLQLRPGTDVALALGMANVIVNEKLYDKEFVDKYTYGWDKFVRRVQEYPLDKVEEITWVQADKIRDAARLYAQTKPACIHWGVGIEHSINCTDNDRSLIDLMAITGNLDVPGGNVFFVLPPVRVGLDIAVQHKSSPDQLEKQLGGSSYKLAQATGITTPKLFWDAILIGKPYPVKAMLLHGINPLMTRANASEIYQALSSLDYLVVTDFFLTPTAELADIVLPAATWLEIDGVAEAFKRHSYRFPRRKIVQIGECWSDHKIFNELGKRMGQDWGTDIEEDLDYMLEPSGLTWKQFKEMRCLQGKMEYRKHERRGFSTPTGKVELYSTIFEKWGYDPLPRYREIPESPVSKPEMAKEYPYILTTGARIPVFFTSEHRMIPWLREIHPDPIVEIHPQAAEKHGIKDGDWVFIESPRGRIKQKAKLTIGIDPRVVHAEYGWWFPEVRTPDHGWKESNANILTDNALKSCDPAMGATNLRALLCKIFPAGEES